MSRNKESLQHQFQRSIDIAFSPGHSKRADRNNVFGHAESKIYSYSTRKELIATAYDLSRYIKAYYPEVKKIKDIKQEMVQSFINNKAESGCTKTTIKQYISRMNKLCILASNMTRSKVDFNKGLIIPTTQKERIRDIVMTEKDYRKIIDCKTKSPALIAVKLSYHFGLRVSETAKLNVENIHKNSIDILRSKGGKSRTVPITSEQQRQVIKEFMQFCSYNNIKTLGIRQQSINKWLNRRLTTLGMKKYLNSKTSIHSCRKAYAEREVIRIANKCHCSYTEAFKTVSVNLGHGENRKELFKVYCPRLAE